MTISLDALVTPLTRDEVKTSIYQVLEAVGVDTTTWKPGAVVRTIIAGVSIVLSALSELQAKIARSGFLELSDGDWLTLVAHHVYNVDRIEATFAEGTLTLTNAGGGVYNLDPDDLIAVNPDTGKTYRNTEAIALGAMETLDITIRAVEAGSSSTSIAGTIVELETELLGVSCSNALAVVGRDDELDPDLRTRCYEKLGALSPMGPWDAYAFAARNAKRPDTSSIGVTRVRQVKDGAGGVTTWVATATGTVTGDPDDPDTDLGIINEAIQQLAAPLAVTAVVDSASAVVLAVTYELWAYNTSGLTDAQLIAAVGTKLSAFVSSQPIGGNVIGVDPGKIFRTGITAAIFSAHPVIFRVDLTLPAADVGLNSNEVAVLGAITPVVHQVAPAVSF